MDRRDRCFRVERRKTVEEFGTLSHFYTIPTKLHPAHVTSDSTNYRANRANPRSLTKLNDRPSLTVVVATLSRDPQLRVKERGATGIPPQGRT